MGPVKRKSDTSAMTGFCGSWFFQLLAAGRLVDARRNLPAHPDVGIHYLHSISTGVVPLGLHPSGTSGQEVLRGAPDSPANRSSSLPPFCQGAGGGAGGPGWGCPHCFAIEIGRTDRARQRCRFDGGRALRFHLPNGHSWGTIPVARARPPSWPSPRARSGREAVFVSLQYIQILLAVNI